MGKLTEQALSRMIRESQKTPLMITRFTSDELLERLLEKKQESFRMYVNQKVYDHLDSKGLLHEDMRVITGFDPASGPDETVYYEVNDHGQPSPVLPEKKV